MKLNFFKNGWLWWGFFFLRSAFSQGAMWQTKPTPNTSLTSNPQDAFHKHKCVCSGVLASTWNWPFLIQEFIQTFKGDKLNLLAFWKKEKVHMDQVTRVHVWETHKSVWCCCNKFSPCQRKEGTHRTKICPELASFRRPYRGASSRNILWKINLIDWMTSIDSVCISK